LASSGGVLRRALRKLAIAVAAVAGLAAGAGWGTGALARGSEPVEAVALASLPSQAQATHRLILNGGPFPYPKDGIVFGNRERQLPPQARGWYREYTVTTPGARDRGARRIVCGGVPPTQPQACYYTDNHYSSFRLIQP
jgi:ribonuclease T1